MSKNKRFLKNFILDPKLQMKYFLLLSIPSLLYATFFCLLVNHSLDENYGLLLELMDFSPNLQEIIKAEWNRALLMTFSFSAFVIFGFNFLMLIFMHRLLGPIFQMKKFFKNMQNGGAMPKLSFRKNDEFKDLEELVNTSFEGVESNWQKAFQEIELLIAPENVGKFKELKNQYGKYLVKEGNVQS